MPMVRVSNGGTSGIPLLVHNLQMTSVSISNTIVLEPGANGVIEADKLTYSKLTFSPGNFTGINAKGVKDDNTIETISVTPSSLSSINFGDYKHLMIYFNQAYGISNTVFIS